VTDEFETVPERGDADEALDRIAADLTDEPEPAGEDTQAAIADEPPSAEAELVPEAAEPAPEEKAPEATTPEAGERVDAEPEATTPETAEQVDAVPEPEPVPEAAEQVGAAPEPAAPDTAESLGPATVRPRVWPAFAVYVGAWAVLIAGMVYALLPDARAHDIINADLYVWFLFGGVALTALGPILGLVVWLAIRSKMEKKARAGLLTRCLIWSATWCFLGTAAWWAGLTALDLVAAGRLG
jgi:hypothetical protein